MKYILFLVAYFLMQTSNAQEGHYLSSTHQFNKFWKKYNNSKSDSATCYYYFSWTAYRGNHPIANVLNREIARMACNPQNDSCPGDSLTENWIEKQSEFLHEAWISDFTETKLWPSYSFSSIISTWENNTFIRIYAYTDTGGAHPNIEYSTISKSTRATVNDWQSLFTDSGEILKLGEAAFRVEKDWFFGKQFYLPRNFYFDESGLNFVYNRGEIAPTWVEISLPYDKIDAFAKMPLH